MSLRSFVTGWYDLHCSAELEEGRLRNEIKRLEQERGELKEKMNGYEVHLPNHILASFPGSPGTRIHIAWEPGNEANHIPHALVLSNSQTCCGMEYHWCRAFYLFHMTSSPLRIQRKTENCHHDDDVHVQGNSSFCGDVGKWKEVLVIYASRSDVKQTKHHCYAFI